MTTTTAQITNNVATIVPQTSAMVPAHDDGGRAIAVFSSDHAFIAAQRMGKALASSSLVPDAYRNNLANVLVAMELASRIGASVLMVMQNLDIVHGRPSWRSSFLIATVNASGRFTPLRPRWEGKRGTAEWGCQMVAKERESGEECVGTLITMAMADAEGWTKKNGSKWRTMPEQMLMYRAASFWTRVYAPELSLGMATAEEASDIGGGAMSAMGHVEAPAFVAPSNPRELEAELTGEVVAEAQEVAPDTLREPGEEG